MNAAAPKYSSAKKHVPGCNFTSGARLVFVLLLVGWAVNGFAAEPAVAAAQRPKVIVSVPPLYAAIAEIAGADFEVSPGLPPGRSEHGYEPSPRDVKFLKSADLLVVVDQSIDGWMTKLAGKVPRIEVLPAVQPHTYQETSGPALGFAARSMGAKLDPHFWTDPVRMGMAVVAVASRLNATKPGTGVVQRAAAFDSRMKKLAAAAVDRAKAWPKVSVILSHASLGYLAKWSGLKVVGLLEPIPHVEPGPKHLRDLVNAAKSNTPCRILAEEQLDRKTANVLSKEAGVVAVRINPLGTTAGKGGKSVEGAYDSYFNGLLDEIAGALK